MKADYDSIENSAKTPLLHRDGASSKTRFSSLFVGTLLIAAVLGTFAVQHIAAYNQAPLSDAPTYHASATRLSVEDSRLSNSPSIATSRAADVEPTLVDENEFDEDDENRLLITGYADIPEADIEQSASTSQFEQLLQERHIAQFLVDKSQLDPTATEQDHEALIQRHAEAHFAKLREQQESDKQVMSHFEGIGSLAPLGGKWTNAAENVLTGYGVISSSKGGGCDLACEQSKVEEAAGGDFCWKDAYGRGVGKIPNKCPGNKQKIGALCYDRCSSDYERKGVDCHQKCKSGWTDHGLLCYNGEATYFAGSKWESCQVKNWQYTCSCPSGYDKCATMCYKRCKPGYGSPGTCSDFCQMSCTGQGYAAGVSPSCPKKMELSPGLTGMVCDSGDEMDAGLCYPKCAHGYKGVGPVCWIDDFKLGNVDFVQCGMAFALDSEVCATTTTDQVVSALEMFYCLGTAFTGAWACAVSKPNSSEGYYKLAKEVIPILIDTFGASTSMIEPIQECIEDKCDPEDMAKMILNWLSIVDPTGISGVVSSFWHPKCNDMRKEYNKNI